MASMMARLQATCHPDRVQNARGLCNHCYKKWLYQNSEKARAGAIATSKRTYQKRKEIYLAKARARYANDPDAAAKAYDYRLAKKYGLTRQDYIAMLEKVNHSCEICGTTLGLVIDHDHATGKIRGILCSPCNIGLGAFRDNVEYLKRTIKYLDKFLKACGIAV